MSGAQLASPTLVAAVRSVLLVQACRSPWAVWAPRSSRHQGKQPRTTLRYAVLVGAVLTLWACTNNPYRPEEAGRHIYYDTFSEEPKHLDPVRSYSSEEYRFLGQIYEPVVQYHYLQRPYTLTPLTATAVPEPRLYHRDGHRLPAEAPAEQVARVVYRVTLRQDVRYQPHPSFARTTTGAYRWHLPPGESFPPLRHPAELPGQETRTLRAEDYIYQIKRLAHPLLECPIYPLLANYIEGFATLRQTLERDIERVRAARRQAGGVFYNQEADERANPLYLDLRQYDLPGARAIDTYTFEITLTKKYPQFLYWLAMPFFSPIPWEVDRFYTQSAAVAQNITLNRFPVGTGPFVLAVNRPNYRMVLRRNPHFHHETYPDTGTPEDAKAGLLADSGKPLPFLDEVVFVLEKEAVPRWHKFLQGYYDSSGIGSDVFDQAIQVAPTTGVELTPELQARGLRLTTSVSPVTYYYAFNMLDDVVGGYGEQQRKLRQALSIALNIEEYIQIFLNGRGIAAQGPIPPGIVGYQEGREGINPVVYSWDAHLQRPARKNLETATRLLAEAGYAGGRDAQGMPLVIFFDAPPSSDAGPRLAWLRKQFAAIGVQMQVRATDYNQFQNKVLQGNFQLLQWGWRADYPDPENFLFLLYGPNAKVTAQGENAANYNNPRFNALFRQMENMENSPERDAIIREMLAIAREDAPWMWGFHSVGYALNHQWRSNAKPMVFGENTLKYLRLDPHLRERQRAAWNRPITLPLWIALGVFVLGTIPATISLYRRQRGVPKR